MSQNAEKPALSSLSANSEADRQQNKKAYRELTSSNKKKDKQAKPGNYHAKSLHSGEIYERN